MTEKRAGGPNRLARETSLYLKQHAENPVDWYPWGEEALARARTEKKPIFLSIGYSSCHWCHVMAHQSFEDEGIARLLNEGFVSIKVDREERPDLDQIYQNVAQIFTGGGGWPLSVFLLPDLRPFFGGTYFPPSDGYGRPGFPRVLKALAEAYRTEHEGVLGQAEKITAAIRAKESFAGVEIGATSETDAVRFEFLEKTADRILKSFDPENGGLRGAPKFPNPTVFTFLWRMGLATRKDALKQAASEAVRFTLLKMAEGGIHDQIAGGFHRYSVDATWSVPHFEKMLYDNALLLRLYSEVLGSGETLTSEEKERFTETIQGILAYLDREMKGADGLYAASQDADSEGEEGKFFSWTLPELEEVLGKNDADLAARMFGVSLDGNFEHGRTVLFRPTPAASPEERTKRAALAERLRVARLKRVPPATDSKAILFWNALLVSGFAWASLALQSSDAEAAKKADQSALELFDAIEKGFAHAGGEGLLDSIRDGGKSHVPAYLDDYAALSLASLDLLKRPRSLDLEARLVHRARITLKVLLERFREEGVPGFSFTGADHESLLTRPRTLFDAATPSGNAVALQAMQILSGYSEQDFPLQAEAARELSLLFPAFGKEAFGATELGSAFLLELTGPAWFQGVSPPIPHASFYIKNTEGSAAPRGTVCRKQDCVEFPVNPADALSAARSFMKPRGA